MGIAHARKNQQRRRRRTGAPIPWVRFGGAIVVTALVVVPIALTVFDSFLAQTPKGATEFTVRNYLFVWQLAPAAVWLRNSLLVALVVVLATVALAGPAGYVLSRGRGRLVSGYALVLFVVQSFPVVMASVPLFIVFAKVGLVDSLPGVTLVYAGLTVSVATWMLAAAYDSVPIEIEEAAWVDGAGILGAFLRVVVPNALPGLLSVAIFAFLTSWNDFLIALIFLRSTDNFTAPLGVEFFGPAGGIPSAYAVLVMLPPVILFALLNRFFTFGGTGSVVTGHA